MAYQTRQRDPLLDSSTQEIIEKRGKELFGMALLALGLAGAAMSLTYTPSDPSFLSATDAPVQNMLGRTGASIAAPVFMIIGWGALAFVALLIGWGLRFVLHRGADRAVSRLMMAPVWVVLCAMYASSLSPSEAWTQDSGLGGHLGDMLMGMMLAIAPINTGIALKIVSLILGPAVLALAATVLGFTKDELKRGGTFLWHGLIHTYDGFMRLLGRGAGGAVAQARAMSARRSTASDYAVVEEEYAPERTSRVIRRDAYEEDNDFVIDDEEPETQGGLRGLMPGLLKRKGPVAMPEPELVENHGPDHEVEAPAEERVRARITSVVRARARHDQHEDTPLTKGRGRRPDPLILDTSQPSRRRGEPPLTARAEPAMTVPMHVTSEATVQYAKAHMDPVVAEMPEAPVAVAPEAAAMGMENLAGIQIALHDGSERINLPLAPAPEPEQAQAYAAEADYDDGMEVDEYRDDYQEDYAADDYAQDDYGQDDYGQDSYAAQPAPVTPRPQTVIPARSSYEPRSVVPIYHSPEDEYELPPLDLLTRPDSVERYTLSNDALEENARMLENVLDDYGIKGEIVSVRPGPVVTMYELEPAPGLKASRVIGLADDIARSMSALSARVSTVPGRSVIGIELPNEKREMVVFREILSSRAFDDHKLKLPLALGKDIGGDPIVANLAKMPHLLIAGTTGSGKSVAINTMILSLLYRLTPDECRLIMIDPKMLELSVYDGIPHLLSPVVTDPKKAVVALKWVVAEMEERYRKMSKMGVRNIDGYNGRVKDALSKGEMFSRTVQTGFDEETGDPVFETEEFAPGAMPYIVVIVDEMADLMMVAGKEIEACIQRLAQMARASGIHLIMATQRPSVDVITGTIKANFPTRISFQVTSKIDSRTILGEQGAEQLLGMGDMLYMAGGGRIQRCHGPFVSDEEVEEIVNHLKAYGPPAYVSGVQSGPDAERESELDAVLGLNTGGNTGGEDALYDQAVQIVIKDRKCSTSYIQRKLGIGYNKAARLVEQMEENSLVSPANHVGKREILVPEQD
ncbi:DNA translocase FtsK [Donghicola sp. C2-DW-16]|uniref:DNA translocase FtsK n=1 Tax=Donghicola mangrovi TaxID=2729614 RepID=A0ABX2PAI4_9RHOB|nr:DNA translocase FtsK [Donghicola mangrovi]NVO25862.1 DNA translocase FtsK [Donghicola mangrovi]